MQLLKACGSDVIMVMKAGVLHAQEEKQESEESDSVFRNSQVESTNGIPTEESCDSLNCLADSSSTSLERMQRASLSPGSDSDISSPDIRPTGRNSLQRTASNPLLDGERSKGSGVGGARRLSDGSKLELEETDSGEFHSKKCKFTFVFPNVFYMTPRVSCNLLSIVQEVTFELLKIYAGSKVNSSTHVVNSSLGMRIWG